MGSVDLSLISRVPLFQGCSKEVLEVLASQMTSQRVPAGQFLVKKGEVAHEMFFICRGEVQVTVLENEQVRTIATLSDGHFFGEMGLLYDMTRTADVKASTETELLVLSRANFSKIRSKHQEIVRKLKQIAEERFNWFKDNLINLNEDFTEEQLNQLKQVYMDVDLDGNGKIEVGELKNLLYRLNGQLFSDQEMELIMKKMDKDGNKTIDFNEFVAGLRHLRWLVEKNETKREKETKQRLDSFKKKLSSDRGQEFTPEEKISFEQVFRDVDADGNGRIDIDELRTLLFVLNGHTFTDNELNSIRKKFDTQNKGYIELDEFLAGLRHLRWLVDPEEPQTPNPPKQPKQDNFQYYLIFFSTIFLILATWAFDYHFNHNK
eukprot:TRINITY_DN4058_c0_g1_i1.p1 TRINITY_DN4058_c0_g1~~TRINITY_DN4058_c0_g1_i1.p1  ORF type:complete len:377 (+),score=109.44 TRINITY_DN4058_c0_g1_i1:114-1244(+)